MRYTYGPNDSDQRYGFKTDRGGYVFKTEREAQLFCQMWDVYQDAFDKLGEIPRQLPRAEYENLCVCAEVESLTDEQIMGSHRHSVADGEFRPALVNGEIGGTPISHCVKMFLANRRLLGIQAEIAARPQVPAQKPPEPESVKCSCGHSVLRSLAMSTSLGSSCPDCYDRMSG